MAKNFLTHSYIDHFLQAEIISRLASTDRPLRFSELKDKGIDNSLFMYHANKLIGRGLIHKTADGFSLTIKGARWSNYAGVFHSFEVLTPRPLIQFVVKNSADQLLVASRKGQLKQLLNAFLLPGNIYRYGLPLEDNVRLILNELFTNTAPPAASLLTIADIIHEYDDGFVHHVISYIFSVNASDDLQQAEQHPLFSLEWVPVESITSGNPKYEESRFLALFLGKLSSLAPHETFVIKARHAFRTKASGNVAGE